MAELADAPDLGSGVLDVQVQVLLPAVEQEKSGRQGLNLFKLLLPAVEQETERRIRREVFGFYGRFRE